MVSKHLGPMLVPLGLDKVDLWDASPPWCKNGEIMDTNKLLLAKKMCMNVMHIVHTHTQTHTGLVVNSEFKSKLVRFEVKSTWVKSAMVWRNNSFINRFIPETVTASRKNRWSQVSQQVHENGVPLSYHRKEWRPLLVPVSLNPLAPPALKLHAALLTSQVLDC